MSNYYRPRVACIGVGITGIDAAYKLKHEDIASFRAFDFAEQLGGTWRDNTYPGAACDVSSHAYSYSWDLNPDWSQAYAGSTEIWAYLDSVCTRHHLHQYFQFSTEVTAAQWDPQRYCWTLFLTDRKTSTASTYEADILLSGAGALVFPSWPKISGLREFGGTLLHSARWNKPKDFTDGQHVAVIGTGASAVQIIQAVAPKAKSLTIYQRTPAWVLPKPNPKFPALAKFIFRYVPGAMRIFRTLLFLISDFAVFPMMIRGSAAQWFVRQYLLSWYKCQVRDDTLRAKITPDYDVGCKRMLPTERYLDTIQMPHVDLVTDPIEHFEKDGIVTRTNGATTTKRSFDTVICATGFETDVTVRPPLPIEAFGQTLAQAWEHTGPETFRLCMTHGFPNYFISLGPNSGTGTFSTVHTIECQVGFMVQAIRGMQRRGVRAMQPKRELQTEYNKQLQAALATRVWNSSPGCNSWYRSGNNEGKNHSLYPYHSTHQWLELAWVRWSEWDLDYIPNYKRPKSSFTCAFYAACVGAAMTGVAYRLDMPLAVQIAGTNISRLVSAAKHGSEIRARRSFRFPSALDRSKGSRTFPSSKLKKTPCVLVKKPKGSLGGVKIREKMPRAEKSKKKSTETAASGGGRKISAYNQYMKDELGKVKADNPALDHKAAFKMCAQNWKTSPKNPQNQAEA
ncbi:hypothetical protein SeLEV6574_g04593 [Synchytrium endobioticum]|uniref:YABBY protein C-terminal domain-containing protein n=1 Tax=Synchytrium endobioticum TaxID=286115 RepID=A0A507CYW2_9FUNG|nr:hypothetical protein SeLEV6574_g04593 [Synchytrium endobioticum]